MSRQALGGADMNTKEKLLKLEQEMTAYAGKYPFSADDIAMLGYAMRIKAIAASIEPEPPNDSPSELHEMGDSFEAFGRALKDRNTTIADLVTLADRVGIDIRFGAVCRGRDC